MAKKPPLEITVTKSDQQRALDKNWKSAKRRLSSPLMLADFAHENFSIFEGIIAKHNLPDNYTADELLDNSIDALHGKSRINKNEAKSFLLSLIDSNKNLFDPTKVALKVVNPEEFATNRAKAQEKKRRQREIRWEAIKHDAGIIAEKSLVYAKAAAKLGVYIPSRPLVWGYKAGKGIADAVIVSANALCVSFNALGIPNATRASLLGMGVWATVAYANGEAPQQFQISIQNMDPAEIKKLPLIAAYDAAFAPTEKTSARDKHAYYSMKSGEKMGVPAALLHFISYLESVGYRDVLAGSSSASKMTASGLFQITNATKIHYMKKHGKKTLVYLDAKENLENGTATDLEKSIVFAVDEFSKYSESKIIDMYNARKMEGPILEGMRLVDYGPMSTQLVAIDMLEKFPELSDPNITIERMVEIGVVYYTRDHFLGAGDYNKLKKLEARNTELLLTDAGLGEAIKNPLFFKKGMKVGQVFDSIHDNFLIAIDKPLKQFKAAYEIEVVRFHQEQVIKDGPLVRIEMQPPRTRWDVTVDTFEKLGSLTVLATEKAYEHTLGSLFADAQEEPAKAITVETKLPIYVDTIVPKPKPENLRGPKAPSA